LAYSAFLTPAILLSSFFFLLIFMVSLTSLYLSTSSAVYRLLPGSGHRRGKSHPITITFNPYYSSPDLG
jgi:hypothetical protein